MRSRRSCGFGFRDVDAVDENAARQRIVEAQQQLERRALACARGPDERHRLARLDLQRHALERERIRSRRIAERDVLETDAALRRRRECLRVRRRDDRRLRILQLDQALHRARCALHLTPHLGERRCGDRDVHGVDQELAQLAAGHFRRQHPVCALPEHERDRAEDRHRADCRQQCAHARAADCHDERVLDRLAVAFRVQPFERERLHGLDRVERFAGEAAGVGDAILRLPRQRA